MIKTLQTCFLALLCLAGSTFSAQSKVAESPGAGLLHRFAGPTVSPHSGDTHRGGIARPDTLEKQRFGLVDSTQTDRQAGQTDILDPAPVTVFLVHRIPESAGNLVVDLWDAEMYGLESFSNHQRIEVPPMQPHLLTGLMPREERGYRFRTPSISTPSILRLSLAHYPVIRDFQVSPGDSVMIKVNEKNATLIITGPSAPKFRLQKELDEVLGAFTQSLDVGLSFNSEKELQSFLEKPGNGAAWDSISTSFGRKTGLKVAGQQELDFLREIPVRQAVLDLQERLKLYEGKVIAADLQVSYARALGSIFQIYLGKISAAYGRAEKLGDQDLTRRFRDFILTEIRTLPANQSDTIALDSPAFREFLIARGVLMARISESDFLDTFFVIYSPEVAERLAVQYLNDNRRRLEDFEIQAASLEARLKSPEMKSVLAELTGRFGKGTPLFSFDFTTLNGKSITQKEFEGKALLIDFWITGCGACKSFHERILDPLIEKYGEHPDLKIISVCADRKPENWKTQGGTPNVIHQGFIPAYAERIGGSNPFLAHYNIHSYPQLMLVRSDGTLFRLSRVPATLAEAEQLLEETLKPFEPTKSISSPTQAPEL